jgi:hypothetical protein
MGVELHCLQASLTVGATWLVWLFLARSVEDTVGAGAVVSSKDSRG